MDIQVTVKVSLDLVNQIAKAEPELSFDDAVEKILQLGLQAISFEPEASDKEVVKTSEPKKAVKKEPKEKAKFNKSLYPKKSIYAKNKKEFENIFNVLTCLGVGIKNRRDCPEDMDAWELTDINGNKAGLYLTCGEWRLDTLRFGQVLRGWFSDYEGDYFQDLLINNDCIVDDEE